MATNGVGSPSIKPTLGLMGATVNAMALIAPGAFLWITCQMQVAATSPSGASVASDIWFGIVVALAIAFLTAYSYSQLAKIYLEAGFASCTYFAEKAFLDSRKAKSSGPKSMARTAKLAANLAKVIDERISNATPQRAQRSQRTALKRVGTIGFSSCPSCPLW